MEAKFVCNLKKYRVAQELTQEQLADIVGVRRETIHYGKTYLLP